VKRGDEEVERGVARKGGGGEVLLDDEVRVFHFHTWTSASSTLWLKAHFPHIECQVSGFLTSTVKFLVLSRPDQTFGCPTPSFDSLLPPHPSSSLYFDHIYSRVAIRPHPHPRLCFVSKFPSKTSFVFGIPIPVSASSSVFPSRSLCLVFTPLLTTLYNRIPQSRPNNTPPPTHCCRKTPQWTRGCGIPT
jgi:hypothetical protein